MTPTWAVADALVGWWGQDLVDGSREEAERIRYAIQMNGVSRIDARALYDDAMHDHPLRSLTP